MAIPFVKAQALGNDFVIIEQPPLHSHQICQIAHRRLGIGCDQVIFFQRQALAHEIAVQFYNPDGSEAEACGNGSRAVISLLAQDTSHFSDIKLKTRSRTLTCQYDHGIATINMGAASVADIEAPLLPSQHGPWGAVDIGNPHLIAFVTGIDHLDIEAIGPQLEYHPAFPQRVNVSIAQLWPEHIDLKTWERGAGYTGACGTAACATAALAHQRHLIHGPVKVKQLGGNLDIVVTAEGIQMSGSATVVFKGEIDL
ncbi:diaminopimelate epimerase [Candidatus Odyssella thessalonicensis]|uniref:diaminopimelate epimerase n=1 Tax=Candidatus Odyssella thessalonicensis TaxID=84647 RepID=UPI000225AF6F|nr:diaminopimelate epimerase [Candidatus Odyssella thessalonicensis]